MFKIKNGVVKQTRGDTGGLEVVFSRSPAYGQCEYTLSIKKDDATDGTYVLQKKSDNGRFWIEHIDTQSLQPGQYIADVEIHDMGSNLYFTIGPFSWIILDDVTI